MFIPNGQEIPHWESGIQVETRTTWGANSHDASRHVAGASETEDREGNKD